MESKLDDAKTKKNLKVDRLSDAMRQNLLRRKQQQRARQENVKEPQNTPKK